MILEIKNLKKEFKRGNDTFFAVYNVNLSVNKKDFISIVGHSGSGKSTLLNLISGLLEPTSGEIFVDGKNIIGLKDKEISNIRNTEVGYILQNQGLLANLTVLQNIRLPYELTHKDNCEKKALKLLEEMGILYLKDSFPSVLSGGEARRVAIARALINDPKILLADEPTSDLDPENTIEIMKLFKKISSKGTAIIMVTHNMETTNYSNTIYKMKDGILEKEK